MKDAEGPKIDPAFEEAASWRSGARGPGLPSATVPVADGEDGVKPLEWYPR